MHVGVGVRGDHELYYSAVKHQLQAFLKHNNYYIHHNYNKMYVTNTETVWCIPACIYIMAAWCPGYPYSPYLQMVCTIMPDTCACAVAASL